MLRHVNVWNRAKSVSISFWKAEILLIQVRFLLGWIGGICVNRVAITGLAMRNTAIRDPSPGAAADSAFQFASWGSFPIGSERKREREEESVGRAGGYLRVSDPFLYRLL